MYITSKKDFNIFKKEVRYWVDFWGLHDFDITMEKDQTNDEALAETGVVRTSRLSVITLENEWEDEPEPGQIEMVAFHEVAETMMSPLWQLALDRFATQEAIETEKHAIINRLQNCVWKPDFDKRKK